MIKRFVALAVSLLITVFVLIGCSGYRIIQPSRKELVGANFYLTTEPAVFLMDLKLISADGVVMYYNSSVTAQEAAAEWNGTAKIYSGNTYFEQSCQTVCDETGSRKQWRSGWAKSDNRSPTAAISKWLQSAEAQGRYNTVPTTPAEHSDYLSNMTDPAYQITWTETDLDWKALCDAHPDTLFGGERLLTNFTQAKVTMFFGAEDLILDVILLEAEGEQGWFMLSLIPVRAESGPVITPPDKLQTGVILSEEWSIISSDGYNSPNEE